MAQGFTIWFTGWSGAGKTTLARALEMELKERQVEHVQRLDGDVVRQDLTQDLGFSEADRNENIRRITFVATLLSNNGVATLVAFISPYQHAREIARKRCQRFVEVYVKCSKDELIRRDPKGLYRKALTGEINNLTGINDPYEAPKHAEIVVETDRETPQQSLNKIVKYLTEKALI